MSDAVRIPPQAEDIAKIRRFIDQHFSDIWGCCFSTLRKVAHDAVDKLLRGDHVGANAGIQKLGAEGARDLRVELRRRNIRLEVAR